MKKVYAYAVVCERILNEIDGITTLIRLADFFSISPPTGIAVDQLVVAVSVFVSIRMTEIDDEIHSTEMFLIRPDGEETRIGEANVGKIVQRTPLAPGGLNFALQVGVVAKQWGLHTIKVIFDGEEVAQAIFTLAQIAETTNPADSSLANVQASV